jgi:hypothetical protein
MYKELYKYLVLNKKIYFPGIGSFVLADIPSSVDEITHIIKPGQQVIRFSINEESSFNYSLFSFIAKERNQTESESENKFNIFIAQLKNYLRSNDVVLPLLGTLKKYTSEEGITFVPQQKNIKHLFPLIGLTQELKVAEKKEVHIPQPKPVAQLVVEPEPQVEEAELVVEEEAAPAIKKHKDSWWIYAIALTLVAATGLLYYYLYYINQVG